MKREMIDLTAGLNCLWLRSADCHNLETLRRKV